MAGEQLSMTTDPTIRDHQAWLGYLQPDGLVVSPAALVDAQAILDRNALPLQERFLEYVEEVEVEDGETVSKISDVQAFLRDFLQWPDACVFGFDPERPIAESLHIPLPELGADLAPTFAFRDPSPKDAEAPWVLLGLIVPQGTDLDKREQASDAQWSASQAQRFERLLRDTKVPIGLLINGSSVRLMYAPHGENSGSLTFPIQSMTEVAGRPILAAFDLLLGQYRILSAPAEARLPALLRRSRDYQSTVSSKLAQQVLDSLYELLRGFQSANERMQGDLLRDVLSNHPDQVYSGLLTVMLRLVFLLYSEDRGLMPGSGLYIRNYSIHGLFERLRSDNERYPDTMDHRFGAWAQLVALFRTVFEGCRHAQFAMPARSGHLFDPARFPFLEGRTAKGMGLPLIPDGVIFRVLTKLLILDGERLSYRTLDVEEIGSVYQTIMGFRLELAEGNAIALSGKRKHKSEVPAPTVVNLDALLAVKPADRTKWLKEQTDHELPDSAAKDVKSAVTLDDLLAGLERRIARDATPHIVPKGTMILQPTDERRRSGSHYTPRTLTQPIVRKTLEPILKRLGEKPFPEQILALKICDPAMGSAAFLVETCRQLADELIKAWHAHNKTPAIPPDEDEVLLARRIVAQRCLYGVDINPMAVDLAKLSMWLVTLAKDHPFTFLDHAFRSGDSLVGLTKAQIAAFHWSPQAGMVQYLGQEELGSKIKRVTAARVEILNMAEDNIASILLKKQKLSLADEAADPIRRAGDLAIAAFFGAEKDKDRLRLRDEYLDRLTGLQKNPSDLVWYQQTLRALRSGEHPVNPFHWEIEFPEVFERENGGFDGIVGNPPFMGGTWISGKQGACYLEWLKAKWEDSGERADLVAYFFRLAFETTRHDGCFGLIATNTIGQGDTRVTGLRWICLNGGNIYAAKKRYKWPGQAAVIVSIVWITRGEVNVPCELDGIDVSLITAYLLTAGNHDNPNTLRSTVGRAFKGVDIYGMGFTFDDQNTKGIATPLSVMYRLISANPLNAVRIQPYIGGEEINDDPMHNYHRYAINFADMSEAEARKWPDLMDIVEKKVKPERLKTRDTPGRFYLNGF
jgi:N-6 DNA Methylase